MKIVECKWCRNNVGVYEENGVEKLKNHIRRIENETSVCPGSHTKVK